MRVKVIETGKIDVLDFVVGCSDILPDLMANYDCNFEQVWDEEAFADVFLMHQSEYDWWIEMIELLYKEQSLIEELEEEKGSEAAFEVVSQYDSDLKDSVLRNIAALEEALAREDDDEDEDED
nr:MAG TPA: hypothetical protein [Inoviridae sp.]